jgi:hypothetical protein
MHKTPHLLATLFMGLLLTWGAFAAEPIALNPDHPDRYQVVPGDTLWDISGRFLRDPWLWPEVWQANPQIQNPHLIYPGDIIQLSFVDGRPRLSLQRGGVIKLSPKVRTSPSDSAIPAIPLDAIQQFLSRSYVVDADTLSDAPYIVSFGADHIMGSSDIQAYVRSIDSNQQVHFDVIRPGRAYKDADSGEILGYAAQLIGNAELLQPGDPATVRFTNMNLEFILGDRLIPDIRDIRLGSFVPRIPQQAIRGSIISVLNGVSQIGQYHVVVLDRGEQDGLRPGDVLAIEQRGEVIRDKITPTPGITVTLPDEPAGTLLVFRVFPRVSFGLVMHATRSIHLRDRVVNP